MKKTKILHCLETVGSGGVEQRRLSLATRLDHERYEQRLLCTKAVGSLPTQFEQAGCTIHEVGIFDGILDRRPYRKALSVIRDFGPDIVHGAVYEGVALAVVAGRLARVPVIIGEETSDPQNRTLKGNALYRVLAAFAHQMVAVSPAVERYLRFAIRLPRSKVTMIPNGVAELPPVGVEALHQLREKLGIESGDFVIGTVGRLFDEHKRVSDLIKAMALVRARVPAAKLLIVGTGPDEERLRKLAIELGVSDATLFVGYQGNSRPFYQIMDIFALGSSYEAFGLVLVEAMFAGRPVVATRVGGIPNVVEEGVTAFLVNPFEPKQLAAAFFQLIEEPALAREFGDKGRIRARELFSEGRYVAEVESLYKQLLSKYCRA